MYAIRSYYAPAHPELVRASTVSPREVAYPLIHSVLRHPSTPGGMIPSPPAAPLSHPFAQAVISRRSRRSYVQRPLPKEALEALLLALRGPAGEEAGLGVRLLVQDEHGLSTFLALDRASGETLTLSVAPTASALADACLGQAWMAKAGALVCFTADLEAAEATHGPGALGLLLTQAGRLGQRIYLAAEAMSADGNSYNFV